MPAWLYSVGNLARRAPAAPAPVSPAVEDAVFPLSRLANDQPDDPAAFGWRSDGVYKADLDLNLLAASSGRSDAPTGWRDLLSFLADTPGLGPNPPDWGSYAGRTALRIFRPVFQDVEVLPGEPVTLTGGLYLPSGSSATAVRMRVIDLSTQTSTVIESQSSADAWDDFSVAFAADADRTQRAAYRVVLEPVGGTGASYYAYVSDPAMFAEADCAALIGHNLPDAATVKVGSLTMDLKMPSCFKLTNTPETTRVWRLDIAMPGGDWPRPIIGEVWIGRAVALVRSPSYPLLLREGDGGQIRVLGSRGRVEVTAPERIWPSAGLTLSFKSPEASYAQLRDGIMRASLWGAEPMLLLPCDGVEGTDAVYHGRVDQQTQFSRVSFNRRTFTVGFAESPFPRLA